MKKIYVLKTIVDILWIFSTISALIITAIIIGVWFIDLTQFGVEFYDLTYNSNDIISKLFIVISSLSYLLLIIALYYFREALTQFVRKKIFEDKVIFYFTRIGNLLLFSGITSLLSFFGSNLYLKSKVHLEFGLNEHVIVICLGLFFTILSEAFKIAKNNKEEIDLTI